MLNYCWVCDFQGIIVSQGKVRTINRWGGMLNHLSMAYLLRNIYTNKKASIRWQDSAPPISGYWPTSEPNTCQWRNDVTVPHYEAKCVQRRCFQCGSVPLRSDIKGTELPPANILIPLERQLIALQLCRWQFLYNETLQQTFRPLLSKLSKDDKFRYFIPILRKLGAA